MSADIGEKGLENFALVRLLGEFVKEGMSIRT